MRWTARTLADASGGTLHPAGADPDRPLGRLSIDSRSVEAGGAFVAIVAARDGHDFVAAAAERGAGACLYQPDRLAVWPSSDVAGVAVDDTSSALLSVGRAARGRLAGPVVGITGSVGKTSTKDLAAAAVGAALRVAANERSFNNELGVPLTLANVSEGTDVTIVEMGARGRGHIALLCEIARPTVAVVTAVAAVHTELFGSLDDVARAKGELVEAIPAGGWAVLNFDDGRVAAMAGSTSAGVLGYSVGDHEGAPGAAVVATGVEVDDQLRPRFVVRSPWGAAKVTLAARGAHQVGNALAAISVAGAVGVPLEAAVAGVETAALSPWRMELVQGRSGVTILNDSYNANPMSMAAALVSLARLPARRRVAVLGAMAELGPEGPAEHRRMAALAADLGCEVLAVGTDAYGVAAVAGVDEAYAAMKAGAMIEEGVAVLLKASRVAGLERLGELLRDA